METYDSSSAQTGALAVFFAVYGFIIIFSLITYVIAAIGKWKVFEKAGKPGWAAIIPIYSTIVMLEIIGKPIWWIVLIIFVPCANIVFLIWTYNLLSKSYGQSEGFTVGLVLLPVIFFPILGFGNYQYLGPSAKEAQGFQPFDPSTTYRDPFNPPPPPPPAS